MKSTISYFALVAVLLGVMFTSCQEEELENASVTNQAISVVENTNDENAIPTAATVLGKKLENPYSVENMKKALSELKNEPGLKSELANDIEIETTHLYVRFLPRTEEELTVLKSDTSLNIYDYPLDYEIKEGGLYYHDPSLPDSMITWQYTVVSPDYKFPPIKYEVLSELFILEEEDSEDEEITLKSTNVTYNSWITLEDKALAITGNLEEEEEEKAIQLKGWFSRRSKWRPAGNIKVYDDVKKGNIPLKGALVRARRWFTIHRGYTDSNGDFSCNGRFRRDANYSIKWERNYWDIRSGTWGQALYNGPKKRGNWDLTISSGKSLHYATIHRAAYRHFYGNNLGMRRPYGAANRGRWTFAGYPHLWKFRQCKKAQFSI